MIRRALLALALAAGIQAAPAARAQAVPAVEQQTGREMLVMLRLPPAHYRPNARYGGSYGDPAAQVARKRIVEGIARRNGLAFVESWPMPLIGVDCFVLRVPEGRPLAETIAQVTKERGVAWAQPLQRYETKAAGDPLFRAQPTAGQWQLAELHRIATGKGVRVAVIDSKVDAAHPDLAGQVVEARDFVGGPVNSPEAHGTAVAGVIAAKGDNGVGIIGVAPEARLMALRACSQGPKAVGAASCDSLSLAKALHFAIENGAQVINLSLSGPQDPLLASLIAVGLQRHISVVAAFDPQLPGGGFPASQTGVISAAEESLPSVPARVYRAPGNDVPTTEPGGRWGLASGNSFAAAQVSGLVALARQRTPRISPALVREADGRLDACATIVTTTRECPCSCAISKEALARR